MDSSLITGTGPFAAVAKYKGYRFETEQERDAFRDPVTGSIASVACIPADMLPSYGERGGDTGGQEATG